MAGGWGRVGGVSVVRSELQSWICSQLHNREAKIGKEYRTHATGLQVFTTQYVNALMSLHEPIYSNCKKQVFAYVCVCERACICVCVCMCACVLERLSMCLMLVPELMVSLWVTFCFITSCSLSKLTVAGQRCLINHTFSRCRCTSAPLLHRSAGWPLSINKELCSIQTQADVPHTYMHTG